MDASAKSQSGRADHANHARRVAGGLADRRVKELTVMEASFNCLGFEFMPAHFYG
ncbi:hypothetical protein Dthio_PD1114 [Desulfonatronospira thiodismutans ASO3-1]|uniref:Uncharacterized protein n=1 Tax=Desulfonatronospira thiodismutans ASO3-1 TaxID=555779 RepID=D6SSV9_9BACT|nr:hypothetical protein Dthio_PD1114 [Desulfonatronospira thiodismutans ASO3-1]